MNVSLLGNASMPARTTPCSDAAAAAAQTGVGGAMWRHALPRRARPSPRAATRTTHGTASMPHLDDHGVDGCERLLVRAAGGLVQRDRLRHGCCRCGLRAAIRSSGALSVPQQALEQQLHKQDGGCQPVQVARRAVLDLWWGGGRQPEDARHRPARGGTHTCARPHVASWPHTRTQPSTAPWPCWRACLRPRCPAAAGAPLPAP
jgi:hypothetical protein